MKPVDYHYSIQEQDRLVDLIQRGSNEPSLVTSKLLPVPHCGCTGVHGAGDVQYRRRSGGVTKHKDKYWARCMIEGKRHSVGRYDDEKEALSALAQFLKEYKTPVKDEAYYGMIETKTCKGTENCVYCGYQVFFKLVTRSAK